MLAHGLGAAGPRINVDALTTAANAYMVRYLHRQATAEYSHDRIGIMILNSQIDPISRSRAKAWVETRVKTRITRIKRI